MAIRPRSRPAVNTFVPATIRPINISWRGVYVRRYGAHCDLSCNPDGLAPVVGCKVGATQTIAHTSTSLIVHGVRFSYSTGLMFVAQSLLQYDANSGDDKCPDNCSTSICGISQCTISTGRTPSVIYSKPDQPQGHKIPIYAPINTQEGV